MKANFDIKTQLFIQSFMNDDAETFLEVGSTDQQDVDAGIFTSVPTTFKVVSNKTCFIGIEKKHFKEVQNLWGVTFEQVQDALQNQWRENGSDAIIVFNII
ncbi:MAG: hypothetical protein Unbinned5434contig1000_19 [Prokaryotic dsDNA virus sp.]|jgi:hypothetical protein|nr:MAG: hypothetical protein Unbinned5434contig1000_19 [Prokaryotic dsDNA virus sp.]|tara:strand:+ start:4909 stop:5211 length:303 start_codon:yes stop_codon:yes gene_type:complete